ncbi:hypothetical protein UFOVP26_90 [uncultured Caudovirales phage]|uniref:Minor tail protein n=1 Tax=uncultured Caudovirales phage TaxID=2100421 RepID=A0A6J5KMT4_9CAUD|nr:hypothetical protein UFOVP26_90 [uncultured Caudovirales phage]CAB4123570.1 hypothetical protein UFOVP44_7 [uncultured Caudovirales phage]CAB5219752.1 hypothetical protein UFOVP220_136 [uncultured Caudovirales phage]
MATLTFPSTLPGVLSNSYGFKPQSAIVRTEVDAGYARVRRRFNQAPTEIDVKWNFTQTQLGIFEKFFENDLYDGASWFYINLFNGTGQSTYTARFKTPYSASTIAREFMWEVTATLEVMARPLPA